MSGRGKRSFRYGARLKVTAPLAAVFIAVAVEMTLVASAASSFWRIPCVIIAALAGLLALAMLRETYTRLRGKRLIVIGQRDLEMPGADRKAPGFTLPFRDIKKLELTGIKSDFNRVLKISHANGELEIFGVMLGSTGELDEIHGLLKATKKTR